MFGLQILIFCLCVLNAVAADNDEQKNISTGPRGRAGGATTVPCANSFDCHLNGECLDNSTCLCDSSWTGPSCGELAVQPVNPEQIGYRNLSEASWGGNVVEVNGTYHMFVAQMANHAPLSKWGSTSQVVRATSSSPLGPFQYQEVVLPVFASNPTIRRLPNGSYGIWFIGGGPSSSFPPNKKKKGCGGIAVAISDNSVFGPWSVYPVLVENCYESKWLNCSFTNPSPAIESDGSVVLAFQAGFCHKPAGFGIELLGVATATSPTGPYNLVTGKPLVPNPLWCLAGTAEDPFLYKGERGWHILAHGMCYAPFDALHFFSANLTDWTLSKIAPCSYDVQWTNSSSTLFWRVERPQLYFPNGNTLKQPKVLYNGVCPDGLNCLNNPGRTFTLARPLG